MHRSILRFTALATLAAAAGCTLDLDDGDLPEPVAAASSAVTAVAGRRWIVFAPPGGCVALAGFNADLLLPPIPAPPAALAPYCLYTWPGPVPPTPAQIGAWQAALGTGDLQEDSALVVPLAAPSAYPAPTAAFLRTQIEARLGQVTAAPTLPSPPPVRVAVLDTTPDAAPWSTTTGQNRHGDTLAALIADIAAAPGAAEISTYLAMPRRVSPVTGQAVFDPFQGGDFGHLSDLARALWRAISDHEALSGNRKLVINLSLGWAPLDDSQDAGEAHRPAARAVRDLIDHAVCDDGALVVAAAGNDTAGPTPASGPMLPAAWTATSASCGAQTPLVVAAYGLDYQDRAIALARPGSAVPLAAPAIGGVAWPQGATVPEPLTGTSVAAALLSAAAAVVWAAGPTHTAQQVTSHLYTNGVAVQSPGAAGALPSDVCTLGLGVPGCPVRRISLCDALAPFAGNGWACVSTPGLLTTSNPAFGAQEKIALLSSLTTPLASGSAAPAITVPATVHVTAGGQAQIYPQPAAQTCSKCLLVDPVGANPVLYGELPPGISSLTSSLTLLADVGAGQSPVAYAINGLPSGASFSVQLPQLPAGVRAAWVSAFVNQGQISQQQEIPVTP